MTLISPELRPTVQSVKKPGEPAKEMLSCTTDSSGKHHIRINSSSLSILQQCFKKAEFVLERKLSSGFGSAATIFGSAIHGALEVFYSGDRADRKLPVDFHKSIDQLAGGQQNVDETYLVYRAMGEFIKLAAPLAELPAGDKRSIANGLWILEHYFDTYIDDPYHIYRDASGPLVERFLETVIYDSAEMKITLFGTIDAILENSATGQILITDHKTSSVVGQDFYNRLKPNHQYTGYVVLAQRELGLTTENFMVNCIQVKAKPKTVRGIPPHFPRQITRRTPEDIEHFIKTTKYFCEQFIRCRADSFFPLGDVNACSMYGGCNFLTICSAPESIQENIIEAKYSGD